MKEVCSDHAIFNPERHLTTVLVVQRPQEHIGGSECSSRSMTPISKVLGGNTCEFIVPVEVVVDLTSDQPSFKQGNQKLPW